LLAACGGGGGGAITPAQSGSGGGSGSGSGSGSGTSSTAKVTLSIKIPQTTVAAATKRFPAYIDPASESMTFSLLASNGVKPATATVQGPFNLTASSPNCASASGGLLCTFSIDAPIGNDIFLATTYRSTNGTGTPLGSGAVALSVAQNATNTANLSLTGPVSSIALLSDSTQLGQYIDAVKRAPAATRKTQATTTSSQLAVLAKDANGNVILNPTTYDVPITLTLNLTSLASNVVTLTVTYAGLPGEPTAPATVTADGGTVALYAPGDTITLTESPTAGNVYGNALVSASFTPQSGPNAGTLQTATPILYDVYPPNQGSIVIAPSSFAFYNLCTTPVACTYSVSPTISEPGYTGAFTINGSYCTGILRIDANNTLTPIGIGSCYFDAVDTNGNAQYAGVNVQQSTASLGLAWQTSPTSVTYGVSSTYTLISQAYDVNGTPVSSSQPIINSTGASGTISFAFTQGAGITANPTQFYYGYGTTQVVYDGTGTSTIVAQTSLGTLPVATNSTPVNAGLLWSSNDARFTPTTPGYPAALQFKTISDGTASVTITPGGGSSSYSGPLTITTTGANAMTCASELTLTPANFGSPIAQSGGVYNITLAPYQATNGLTCTLTATETMNPTVTSMMSVYINNLQLNIQGRSRR
jgi:hypothetical protein